LGDGRKRLKKARLRVERPGLSGGEKQPARAGHRKQVVPAAVGQQEPGVNLERRLLPVAVVAIADQLIAADRPQSSEPMVPCHAMGTGQRHLGASHVAWRAADGRIGREHPQVTAGARRADEVAVGQEFDRMRVSAGQRVTHLTRRLFASLRPDIADGCPSGNDAG